MKSLLQLISDGEQPSTMRLAVLLIIIPLMTVWTVLSIKRGEFVAIDWNLIGLIATALAGKSAQSFAENRPPAISSQPSVVSQPPTPPQ